MPRSLRIFLERDGSPSCMSTVGGCPASDCAMDSTSRGPADAPPMQDQCSSESSPAATMLAPDASPPGAGKSNSLTEVLQLDTEFPYDFNFEETKKFQEKNLATKMVEKGKAMTDVCKILWLDDSAQRSVTPHSRCSLESYLTVSLSTGRS